MQEQLSGRIQKGIGGFYYILCGTQMYTCRARGSFRHDNISPEVGDMVRFHGVQDAQVGIIDEILPRKNLLYRPPIANIDQIIIVACVAEPLADRGLLDRLFINAKRYRMNCVLVINKCDISAARDIEGLEREYQDAAADIICASARTGLGVGKIRGLLAGKTSCLAGQSGTGKSSLLNALLPQLNLETGQVSERTGRGRHTTRHVELIEVAQGWLADTPGFSLLDLEDMAPQELKEYYQDFEAYEDKCRFTGCLHCNEPGCAVQEAAENGQISMQRLERYREQLETLKDKWRRRYD